MNNPLHKRLPRELKKDFGKYFVIFAFLVLLISLISGFFVATESAAAAYYKWAEENNQEDGHFAFNRKPPGQVLRQIRERGGVELTRLWYKNLRTDKGRHIRLYEDRRTLNKACLMAGRLPRAADEIALDRLFAANNGLRIGDTFTLAGKTLRLTGTFALPDYSCLFENNADSLLNATLFSPALMTRKGFDLFPDGAITYNYGYTYDKPPERDNDRANRTFAEALLDTFKETLTDYNTRLGEKAKAAAKALFLDAVLKEAEPKLQEKGLKLKQLDFPAGRAWLLKQLREQLAAAGKDAGDMLPDDAELSEAINRTPEERADLRAFLDTAKDKVIEITDFLPAYMNQAINFSIKDIGGDTASFVIFDYLVTAVIAFIFAVTISSTIQQEEGVIGTLRASGYTRGELLRHYMTMPLLVSLAAGAAGNILGYTVLKGVMAGLYYHSYSLPRYVTIWNLNAFVQSTIIPTVLLCVINFVILSRKLRLPVIRFLRHDLARKTRKKAIRLSPRLPFLQRFRVRVILRNLPGYFTLFLGIFLGGTVIVFSLLFKPLIQDYKDAILKTRLAEYQYIVKNERVSTETEGAEKFCLQTLSVNHKNYPREEVAVYGVAFSGRYVKAKPAPGETLVSSAFAAKYRLKPGDEVRLQDTYKGIDYAFKISGVYRYEGGLALFMGREDFNRTFDKKPGYFTGYFSGRPLDDLAEEDVVKVIDEKELSKLSDQMMDSMGGFMSLVRWFGVAMFMLLMYLLSRQIIETNANAISLVKILGFRNREISRVYILATGAVVMFSLLLSCPLIDLTLRLLFENVLYRMMKGYLPFRVSRSVYLQMVGAGILCSAAVGVTQMIKIGKISKADILKYAE